MPRYLSKTLRYTEMLQITIGEGDADAHRPVDSLVRQQRHRALDKGGGHKRVSGREDNSLLGREPVESSPARHGRPVVGRPSQAT